MKCKHVRVPRLRGLGPSSLCGHPRRRAPLLRNPGAPAEVAEVMNSVGSHASAPLSLSCSAVTAARGSLPSAVVN